MNKVLVTGGAGYIGFVLVRILLEKSGNNQIILLHCVSVYPPEMETVNLRNMTTLQQAIKKGTFIKKDDLDFKRPGTGIAPDQEIYLTGRQVIRNIDEDAVLK